VDATVAGEPAPPLTDSAGSLGRLVAELHTLDFAALPQSEIVGRLPALQEAWAQLMVRYLKACLDATRERTARNPEGRFVVTRAVGFLLGSDQLDTTKAYDVVNSIARVGSAAEATDDAELRAVFEQARKRGRRSRGADTQIQPD
jgi:hypothetical protein